MKPPTKHAKCQKLQKKILTKEWFTDLKSKTFLKLLSKLISVEFDFIISVCMDLSVWFKTLK